MEWMQLKYENVFSKTSKKRISTVALQNYTKISFIRLIKNLSYLMFSQQFSNRPYPSVKTILAYFHIIKTI